MPEGDTIAWTAKRIRPALEGRRLDEVHSPRNPQWSGRLQNCLVRRVDTYGKHLFLALEGGLVLHSHLGMTGSWRVRPERPRSLRTWLAMRVGERWIVQQGGSTLELLTEGRRRFDQRLAGLGPDVLAEHFDAERFLTRLRGDDQTRAIGDALLDQRNVAGIGNIWKSEGCWEAAVDPWRRVAEMTNGQALSVVEGIRPRMMRSASEGPLAIQPRVYGRRGMPCPRCGGQVRTQTQGDANRRTYWCAQCQI